VVGDRPARRSVFGSEAELGGLGYILAFPSTIQPLHGKILAIMNPTIQALIVVECWRTVCVLAGCLFGYFGYRLFRIGIYEKQGELRAEWSGKSLALRQVGPGVFFALFGILIAMVGVVRKFDIESSFGGSSVQQVSGINNTRESTLSVSQSPQIDDRRHVDTIIEKSADKAR
jgi:hypothetical protein